MPTGYTAKLMDKGESFEDFTLGCARAFGALIMMRDDPADAPIPARFEPSPYHTNAIAAAKEKLRSLESLDSDGRFAFSTKAKADDVARCAEYIQEAKAENARLDEMMAQVVAWKPPTPEHEGLRSFMIEQLTISRTSMGWRDKSLADAVSKPHGKYFDEALAAARHDIQYHTDELAKERARTEERNGWVTALRDSLKVTA